MTMFVGDATVAVVKDQIGPGVEPLLFLATICQKYVVPPLSPLAEYDAAACPVDTCGGGLLVPNFTS